MDSPAHYFEFIQKTYEGKVIVDIKVCGEIQCTCRGREGGGREMKLEIIKHDNMHIWNDDDIFLQWKQPNSEEFVEMDFRTFAKAAECECTHTRTHTLYTCSLASYPGALGRGKRAWVRG